MRMSERHDAGAFSPKDDVVIIRQWMVKAVCNFRSVVSTRHVGNVAGDGDGKRS